MESGKLVFAQLMDFVPRHDFDDCVRRYGGDRRPRGFSCRDQFLCLAFAQNCPAVTPGLRCFGTMPEDLSKFFEPMLDPLLAVDRSLAAQAGPPDVASHAVIPTSYGEVDELGTRDRQGWISWNDACRLTTLMTRVHLVALGAGEHHQRCLSSLCARFVVPGLRSGSQPAVQPRRIVNSMVGARRSDAEMGCTL